MSERDKSERTIVGVPFYDGEPVPVLKACLTDINQALNHLGTDAQIVVGINGPRVCRGETPLSEEINKSDYNADLKFIRTLPGQVAALKQIVRYAEKEGVGRIFLTDADISRLPETLEVMWKEGDKPIVGAHYCAYPVEIMVDAGVELNEQEKALIDIFEADKHPLVREFTQNFRPNGRIKGSLILVDTELAKIMHGHQKVTTDSRMNFNTDEEQRQVVDRAGFMHYPRISVNDHVRARLRHYHAAANVRRLSTHHANETRVSPWEADATADKIISAYPDAQKQVSDFLLREALRLEVADICYKLACSGELPRQYRSVSDEETDLTRFVRTFQEADATVNAFLRGVDWNNLSMPENNGMGTTQNNQSRVPINLKPYLKSPDTRGLIYSSLGIAASEKVK